MRAEFDRWVSTSGSSTFLNSIHHGEYIAWAAWQAARAQPAGEAVALSAEEHEFLRRVYRSNGGKLNNGEAWGGVDGSVPLWKRLEGLGFIESIGGYKWRCKVEPTFAPPAQVPDGFRIVGAAELAMVLNALNRDAEEGRPVRKEMADALASSVDRGLEALAAAPQPKVGGSQPCTWYNFAKPKGGE